MLLMIFFVLVYFLKLTDLLDLSSYRPRLFRTIPSQIENSIFLFVCNSTHKHLYERVRDDTHTHTDPHAHVHRL